MRHKKAFILSIFFLLILGFIFYKAESPKVLTHQNKTELSNGDFPIAHSLMFIAY
jgi:hypothetical protein